MNFNFGEVLTRAWQIIWKHKVLWVFGIFAGCSRGGGSAGGGGSGGGTSPSGGSPFPFERMMNQFGQWIGDHPWVVALFIAAALVIIVLSIFLGTIGRIGLIKGTYQAEQGAEQLVFGELFSASMPYFWRVLGLSFLVGLVFLVIFLPIVVFGVLTAGIGFVCLLPLICLLVPVSLGVNLVIEQANAAIVLNDLGIMDGLRRGWDVVKSNIGPIIIMAIILGVISFAAGLVLAIPILIVLVPLFIGMVNGDTFPFWIAGVCCAVYLPILLVLNGILTSFIQSSWTLTYMRLTRKPDEGTDADSNDSKNTTIAGANA